jgi:S1-C subfamily serine protease
MRFVRLRFAILALTTGFLLSSVIALSGESASVSTKILRQHYDFERPEQHKLAAERHYLSQVSSSVSETARLVTVRVFSSPRTAGSGVIIERQGQIYTVVTCDHVANSGQNNQYTILTPDGKTYQAYRQHLSSLESIDLTLLKFESVVPYQVVVLGNFENVSIGEPVYASGFPNYYDRSPNRIDETFDWGVRAFRVTPGTLAMLLGDRSLARGYKLGYTNDVDQGMSGGALLNRSGELIGINGRGKYPLQGIDAFRFTDGTIPSQTLFEQLEALSWAIPISIFQQKASYLPTNISSQRNPSIHY